jgi:hypothetical protein
LRGSLICKNCPAFLFERNDKWHLLRLFLANRDRRPKFLYQQCPHDDLSRISRQKRDDAGNEGRTKTCSGTDHKPGCSQCIAGGQPCDHSQDDADKARCGRFCASLSRICSGFRENQFYKQSCQKCGGKIADDIASGRPGENSKSAFEPCKYRDAYCSEQDIYDQADGSVFFTEDPAREEYTQCCQIDGNRRKSKRDRNKGADRHEGGEDPA